MNAAPQNSPSPATVAAQSRRTTTERITGAKAIVRSLEELGADVVFGIPGGAAGSLEAFPPAAGLVDDGLLPANL